MHCEFARSPCEFMGTGCLPTMRFCRHFAVFVVVLAACAPLWAQAPGPIVRDIAVEYVGPPSISKERVLDNLATRLGLPYSERAAEADIRSLYAMG